MWLLHPLKISLTRLAPTHDMAFRHFLKVPYAWIDTQSGYIKDYWLVIFEWWSETKPPYLSIKSPSNHLPPVSHFLSSLSLPLLSLSLPLPISLPPSPYLDMYINNVYGRNRFFLFSNPTVFTSYTLFLVDTRVWVDVRFFLFNSISLVAQIFSNTRIH